MRPAAARSSSAARSTIEEIRKDREAIIITEIPYQVNKATLIERIAELVREKRIEGISDLRDESDRDGMRIVIEMKRDAVAEVVLNQLYRFTPLQTLFGVNMLALEWRPARNVEPAGCAEGLHRLPRGSRQPGAPNSCSTRRATALISRSASPSPSPISTK